MKRRRKRTPAVDRFNAKVTPGEDGCLLWTGSTNGKGYGQMLIADDRKVYAHRFAYEQAHGRIEAGMELDHLCRNPSCVNPDHLEPVTHRENMARSPRQILLTTRTHCGNGHEYTPENTRWTEGRRCCRACDREGQRRRVAALALAKDEPPLTCACGDYTDNADSVCDVCREPGSYARRRSL